MLPIFNRHPSSYRDPSGFIFYKDGILYRQVNQVFQKKFALFIKSGLYQKLVERKLLIPHETIHKNLTGSSDWYLTLQPEKLPFISYPYEWCFNMLKDAALLTLTIAEQAMESGMMLKDASAYNIQIYNGKMIFIDTLSFEEYDEQKPWIGYRQFCEHFFAPLSLMHYLKQPLQNLFIGFPDGIPLNIASAMLPFRSKLNLHNYLHLHLQSSVIKKNKKASIKDRPFAKQKMKNLLRSLEDGIHSFSFSQTSTTWSNYYEEATQRGGYMASKKQIVGDWLSNLNFKTVCDAGANKGAFSELVAGQSAYVISWDADHCSINELYKNIQQKNTLNIYPLVIDLGNPSPSLGLNNEERTSFLARTKVDLTLALALIHHLTLGRNIPFTKVAELFWSITKYLVIEFVPTEDEKVKMMTLHKKDLLAIYSEINFEGSFQNYFSILNKQVISDSGRILYLMEKKNA